MSKTFAEKALARASGQTAVVAGQIVDARPDVILSHDNTAAIWKIFRALGVARVKYPERLAITLDHAVPAPTTQHAQNHADVRKFVDEMGVTNFFEVGRGICHQVLSEEAIILPGQTILGASKAAIKLFTEGLRSELLETNVRVTVIFPGAIGTNIAANSGVNISLGADAEAQTRSFKPMPPRQAAEIIVTGIEKNRYRIFVGSDAKFTDRFYRLSPERAANFIYKQMRSLLKE